MTSNTGNRRDMPADRHQALDDGELNAVARYIHEVGFLKRLDRSGWLLAGVTDPESVAEHTFRTAVVGFVLAQLEGADPARTVLLCLFHDCAETRTGDIASVGEHYLPTIREDAAVKDQLAGVPDGVAAAIGDIIAEFEERTSLESRLAKDADRIECLAQALEYVASGVAGAESFVEGVSATIESESGIALARALRENDANEWWRRFVEQYRGRPAKLD